MDGKVPLQLQCRDMVNYAASMSDRHAPRRPNSPPRASGADVTEDQGRWVIYWRQPSVGR